MFPQVKILLLTIIIVTPALSAKSKTKKVKLGPHWDHRERTTCDEFGKYARFNPYTTPNETWFLFYYWAPMPSSFYFSFEVPTKRNYTAVQKYLEGHTTPPVNWTAKHLFLRMGVELSLLQEQGDRGEYLLYDLRFAKPLPPGHMITPEEVRIKQTGDNKIIGIMFCKKEMTFALVRLNELPPKNKLQEEAARLKYRSRGGKSYLYQGHHWMPIPEQDEDLYWNGPSEYFVNDPSSW